MVDPGPTLCPNAFFKTFLTFLFVYPGGKLDNAENRSTWLFIFFVSLEQLRGASKFSDLEQIVHVTFRSREIFKPKIIFRMHLY